MTQHQLPLEEFENGFFSVTLGGAAMYTAAPHERIEHPDALNSVNSLLDMQRLAVRSGASKIPKSQDFQTPLGEMNVSWISADKCPKKRAEMEFEKARSAQEGDVIAVGESGRDRITTMVMASDPITDSIEAATPEAEPEPKKAEPKPCKFAQYELEAISKLWAELDLLEDVLGKEFKTNIINVKKCVGLLATGRHANGRGMKAAGTVYNMFDDYAANPSGWKPCNNIMVSLNVTDQKLYPDLVARFNADQDELLESIGKKTGKKVS